MPHSQSELSRVAIELQRQLQYWQQCYYKLNDKYKCIKAKYDELSACHKCINEDKKDEIESPSAKKQKMNSDELVVDKNLLDVEQSNFNEDENRKDPLKYLPEPVAVEILEYLKGKELLTAMEVSKTWRDFIKVQSKLMKKIIFKPTRDMCELPILDAIENEENMRLYRHFEGPIYLRKKYYIEAHPIVLLSSTLETLIIKPNTDKDVHDPLCHHISTKDLDKIGIACDFPKLKMLTYPINSSKVGFDLLEISTFPVLTHLKVVSTYSSNPSNIDLLKLKEFLGLFPKLEAVMFDDYYHYLKFYKLSADDVIKFKKNPPSIKAITISKYYDEILDIFKVSLEKLEIPNIFWFEFNKVLKNCKNLKSLSIIGKLAINAACEFERNESIEVLIIYIIQNFENDISRDTSLDCIKSILTALPSLKELRLEHRIITEDVLKFLARNMINLNTLICHEINEEMQRAYDDIQANPHLYVNPNFQFTDAIRWNEILHEFA